MKRWVPGFHRAVPARTLREGLLSEVHESVTAVDKEDEMLSAIKARRIAAEAVKELETMAAKSKVPMADFFEFILRAEEFGLDSDTGEERGYWLGFLTGFASAFGTDMYGLLGKLRLHPKRLSRGGPCRLEVQGGK